MTTREELRDRNIISIRFSSVTRFLGQTLIKWDFGDIDNYPLGHSHVQIILHSSPSLIEFGERMAIDTLIPLACIICDGKEYSGGN